MFVGLLAWCLGWGSGITVSPSSSIMPAVWGRESAWLIREVAWGLDLERWGGPGYAKGRVSKGKGVSCVVSGAGHLVPLEWEVGAVDGNWNLGRCRYFCVLPFYFWLSVEMIELITLFISWHVIVIGPYKFLVLFCLSIAIFPTIVNRS